MTEPRDGRAFYRYIGFDYSGAEVAEAGLKELRLIDAIEFQATGHEPPNRPWTADRFWTPDQP